jgi:hypothetical protein
MPSAAPDGALLVAYSTGGVNHNSTCTHGDNEVLRSGIYLVPDAEEKYVTDPKDSRQLVKLLQNDAYNALWPRAVVSYAEVHGLPEPRRAPVADSAKPSDDRLESGEPCALVGSSSLYNRESAPLGGDPFKPFIGREQHSGAWMIQGTDAGVVKNSDIYGLRIIGAVPKPFRKPIDKSGPTAAEFKAVLQNLPDGRMDRFVEGFTSSHFERWKILAEIPVRKTDEKGNPILDPKGDPDTSFLVKVPAMTPFFYQGIDKNGMTLFSETTWRVAVPGEVRADCGGCHAHSIAPVDFAKSAAGRRVPIKASGLDATDPMIQEGLWDVTSRTPILSQDAQGAPIVTAAEGGMVDVEYHRDVQPILEQRCVSCHSTVGNKSMTDLAFDGKSPTDDPYFRLVRDKQGKFGGAPPGGLYDYPQLSRYVRANQARQSLLIWKLYNQRLDGRQNGDRPDDLDFTPHSKPHGATLAEIRTISRWIDLGCPMDFQSSIHAGYRYTDDNGLPVLNVATPVRGWNGSFDGVIRVGAADAESGIDWASLQVALDDDLSDGVRFERIVASTITRAPGSSVVWVTLLEPLPRDRELLLSVEVKDNAGNSNRETLRFWISDDPDVPPAGGPPPPVTPGLFRRGDANRDGRLSIGDPTLVLSLLFFGKRTLLCYDAADANDDGRVDLSDVIMLLSYLYVDSSKRLPEPYLEAGTDPTSDRLDCRF